MKSAFRHINKVAPSIVLLALAACVTTGGEKSSSDAFENEEGLLSYELGTTSETPSQTYVYRGPTAVRQIGSSQIAFSREGQPYWIGLKQSKDELKRISGLLAAGNHAQAISASKLYLEKNPQDSQALLYLATALAFDMKFSLAAYYAKAGLRLRPGDSMLLNIAGLSLYLNRSRQASETKSALEYLEASLKNDPSQIAAALNLGGIYQELGKPKESQVYYQIAAKRCGQCTASLLGSGAAYLREKNYSQAKSAFEKVITKEPYHGAALYNLAVVYKNGYQDHKQAEKYLFTLLNRTGKTEYALRARAQSFLRMIKSEPGRQEKSVVYGDYKKDSQGQDGVDDKKDAELLMTLGEGVEESQ